MSPASLDLQDLRNHFNSGATRNIAQRRTALLDLRKRLIEHEADLLEAMHADMRKPRFEAYMSDIGLVLASIDHTLKHLSEWTTTRRVTAPLAIQVADGTIHHEPLGVVLIIAPWNYPVLLLLSPLVGAIAAGNCVVLKPSEEVPATTAVVQRIIAKTFAPEHVAVAVGPGSEVVPDLMRDFRFDHVFFTGSQLVGRKILALAAPQLVPVTLELGGKNPAIVDREANVKAAAQRIAWSKYFNAGQTCIAPDHALVHTTVMEEFLAHFARAVKKAYGTDAQQSPHFARLVNNKRFDAVRGYLEQGRILIGGEHEASDRYIAPTVLTDVPLNAPVMKEEIFGPILPVIPWNEPEDVISMVARNPFPLATYIFTHNRWTARFFTERIAFGGGCVNHCMVHFGHQGLPFGGVGTSGMGRYHGRNSFDVFSHHKSMVTGSTLIDAGIQYPPYSTRKEKVLRWILG